MSIESEAAAGEKVELPDPLARVKLIARMGWPLAAALVLALAVLGDALRHSIHWGDFPTWLLGITTLLAFLAATFAGVVAYDLLKIEAARDEVASQERREAAADRRQAALDRERAERKRVEDSHLATYERVEHWKADRRAQARNGAAR